MLNKIYLVGNVGHSPDIRVMQDGREIATLSLATHSSWKDKQGNRRQDTEWHRITVFPDFYVEWIKSNVRKGSSLLVEGKLSYAKWEDKLKNKRRVAHIVIYNREGKIQLLNSGKVTLLEESAANKNQPSEEVPELEEIPLENPEFTSLSHKGEAADE